MFAGFTGLRDLCRISWHNEDEDSRLQLLCLAKSGPRLAYDGQRMRTLQAQNCFTPTSALLRVLEYLFLPCFTGDLQSQLSGKHSPSSLTLSSLATFGHQWGSPPQVLRLLRCTLVHLTRLKSLRSTVISIAKLNRRPSILFPRQQWRDREGVRAMRDGLRGRLLPGHGRR